MIDHIREIDAVASRTLSHNGAKRAVKRGSKNAVRLPGGIKARLGRITLLKK